MGRPKKATAQITFRIPLEWFARADVLALESSGALERTDVFRTALAKGLATLEKEGGVVWDAPAKSKKRA